MPEIKRIAIANPSHAPRRMAAKDAMEKTGIWNKVKDRLALQHLIDTVLRSH